MIKEFKEFISKGNVMDLATGMIIGAAFTAIVTSLVNDIISPLIGLVIGHADFSQFVLKIGTAEILIGNFINAIINFLIIGFVIFMIVKLVNKLRKPAVVEDVPAAPSNEEVLLAEIRDLLKK